MRGIVHTQDADTRCLTMILDTAHSKQWITYQSQVKRADNYSHNQPSVSNARHPPSIMHVCVHGGLSAVLPFPCECLMKLHLPPG